MIALGLFLLLRGAFLWPTSFELVIGLALLGFAVVWWIDNVREDLSRDLLIDGDRFVRPRLRLSEALSGRIPPFEKIDRLKLVDVKWSYDSGFGYDGQPVVTFQHPDGVRFRLGVVHHGKELRRMLVVMYSAGRITNERLRLEVESWRGKIEGE